MIERRVVLILGAGASNPYGYPIGSELVARILKTNFHNEIPGYFSHFGVGVEQLASFQKDLQYSMRTSIDAFLETNPQYQVLGKVAIALLLTQAENDQHLYSEGNQEDWYRYFSELVFRNCWGEGFEYNRFSIVSYNYDRSFEFAFFRALRRFYPHRTEEQCYELFCKIPILHPHGLIGSPKLIESLPGRSYSPISKFDELKDCVDSMRIISDDIDKDPVYIQIHQLLKQAEGIVFLGFGYNELNLSRLRLSEIADKEATFYGTCLGFTESEKRKLILEPLSGYKSPGLFSGNVLEFLRTHLELFLR